MLTYFFVGVAFVGGMWAATYMHREFKAIDAEKQQTIAHRQWCDDINELKM